jgi:3-oxoadipate enol-lactonase
MQALTIDDTLVHYAVTGPEDAPALVCSNSLGTDLRVWDPLMPHLQGRFRVVRYDTRGHGLSGVSDVPYTVAGLARDLVSLLDALEVRDAIVCGLSVGGMIAQSLAAARPDLARALVLCDTAHRIGPPQMWDERIAAIEAGGIEALAEPIMERWLSPGFRRERQAESAAWRNMLVRTPVAGYLGVCAAIRDADLTASTAALDLPTLCLCGSEDGATPPALVRELAALVPGARYAEIAGAGHLPCVERPAQGGAEINAFMAEVGIV